MSHIKSITTLTLLLQTAATAQTITTLALEGDVIAGVGAVDRVDSVDVNSSGSWIIVVDTDHPNTLNDDFVIQDGTVIYRLNDPLVEPAGASIGAFSNFSLDDQGAYSMAFALYGQPMSTNEGLYLGDDLVVQKGDFTSVPSLVHGTTFLDFSNTVPLGPGGRLLTVATFDDPLISSLVDHAVMVFTYNAGTTTQEVIAQEGQLLPGQTEVVADFGSGGHQYAQNRYGQVAYVVDLAGLVSVDSAVYLDDTLIVQEGSPVVPEPGSTWGSLADAAVDVNRYGQVVVRARLKQPSLAQLQAVVFDGEIIARQGWPVPGLGGELFTTFGSLAPLQCSDNGDVACYADWSGSTSTDTGILVNDEVLVREGVTMIGGLLVEKIWEDDRGFRMSDDGRYLVFRGQLAGGLDGAFLIDRGPRPKTLCLGDGTLDVGSGPVSCPCSNDSAVTHDEGCLNSTGRGARLSVTGSLQVAAADTVFTVRHARPSQPGLLLQGTGWQGLPFRDGIYCLTSPTWRLEVLFADAAGMASSTGDIAALGSSIPGSQRFFQYWYRDPSVSPCATGSNFSQALTFNWQ